MLVPAWPSSRLLPLQNQGDASCAACWVSMLSNLPICCVPAATARVFSMKVGVLPDRVLMSLMNDRMVAKGTILEFVTDFFQDYLATDNMDDLVILLRKVG